MPGGHRQFRVRIEHRISPIRRVGLCMGSTGVAGAIFGSGSLAGCWLAGFLRG